MSKKIINSCSILLALILAILLWREHKKDQKMVAVYAQMNEEIAPVSMELNKVQVQISSLERKEFSTQAGKATAQFLISDLSNASYKQIMVPMLGYHYPVALGISYKEMPGKENCLTVKEAKKLVNQGWYFCYMYHENEIETSADQAETALEDWLEKVRLLAEEQGFQMSHVICFPEGTYREEFTGLLKEKGIQTVIHHGEKGYELLRAEQKNGIWYAGSAWWRGNEILDNKLSTISATGGELVIEMGIDGNAKDRLEDWMSRFQNILSGHKVEVTDFSDMTQIQEENENTGNKEAEGIQTQIKELKEQAEALKEQMNQIMEKYKK